MITALLICLNFLFGEPALQILHEDGSSQFTVAVKNLPADDATIVVFDATGKYVFLKNYRVVDGEVRDTVDFSRLPKGVYIFEAECNGYRQTKRIVYL